MTTHTTATIPRFALPFTPGDFAAGCKAVFSGVPPSDTFRFLDGAPRFWTRSGRQALRLLLTSLDLKSGSGVATPLFTDPSVVTAIAAAGHRPVFIDVEEPFLTMDPASLHAARGSFSAVVIVHLFGHMADAPALLDAAGGAPIIEDAAHAPLSSLNGRLAGAFGVASFYSFASTKYWSAGGGGLALVNDPALARKFATLVESLPPSSRISDCLNLTTLAAKAAIFNRNLYATFGKPMRRWVERFTLLEPSMDNLRINRANAAVARRQAITFPDRVARQRANSLRLLRGIYHLRDVGLPFERPGARHNYHLFPVLLRDSKERAAIAAALWSRRVDTSMIYFNVVEQCRRYGYGGGCPVSESVADRLLTLPNYSSLHEEDIDRVAKFFDSALRAYRGAESDAPAGELVAADSRRKS